MKKLMAFLAAAVMSVEMIGVQVSAKMVDFRTDVDYGNIATPAAYDYVYDVSLSEDGLVDIYKFVPSAGGSYRIDFKRVDGTASPVLTVYKSDMKIHEVIFSYDPEENRFDAEAGETYYIVADTGQRNSYSKYTFSIDDYRGTGNPYAPILIEKAGDVYLRDGNGKFVKGWGEYESKWYYFDNQGRMQKGWLEIAGKWYYLNPDNGVMVTGWKYIEGKWYFFSKSGVMYTGWMKSGWKWYYFNKNGTMATDWKQIGGKWYYFDYDGVMVTGWQNIDDIYYYFKSSGEMLTGWQEIEGDWYYFKSNGSLVTGWAQVGGRWYFFDQIGIMQTGWLQQGSKWYYLKASGEMATGTVTIDGRKNVFDNNGVWKGYAT